MSHEGKSAAWWRAYRRTHKERVNGNQRLRRTQRRAEDPIWYQDKLAKQRTWHAAHQDHTSGRETNSLPLPYTGHPLLEQAREIAGAAWYGNVLYDPMREDAAGEAVLAMCAGADPRRAVQRFLDWHRRIRSYELPLYQQED